VNGPPIARDGTLSIMQVTTHTTEGSAESRMVTPARRQYLDLKEQYPDALLFFQIGDFYETFDDDAKIVARDAEVHLTSTAGRGAAARARHLSA